MPLAGDRDAFSQLLSECESHAYRQSVSILRDPHHAADATQETLIAAFLGLASLRDASAFSHWLSGIVRHQCHPNPSPAGPAMDGPGR